MLRARLRPLLAILLTLTATMAAGTPAGTPLVALGGRVVTPEGVLGHGWVVVGNGKIVSVSADLPDLPPRQLLRTNDTIYPGFVDLHNHPLFDMLPRWQPAHLYDNRYQWRNESAHVNAVTRPVREMTIWRFCEVDEFAEMKAVIGGTTSLLGIGRPPAYADFLYNALNRVKRMAAANDRKLPSLQQCVDALARNLDWPGAFPGGAPQAARVEAVLGVTDADLPDERRRTVSDGIRRGAVDLLTIHLAEGRKSDAVTRAEFAKLQAAGLLNAHTAIVHGISLDRDQFRQMRQAGAALIWSPRSNLALYGQTADVLTARQEQVALALAPDWAPTGSNNMLAELGFAHAYSLQFLGGRLTPHDLFLMATSTPARIAHVDDKIGSVAAGRYADLFLLAGDTEDPYQALVKARPEDVTLVMIGGTPVFGSPDHLQRLDVWQTETVTVCGATRAVNAAALPAGPLAPLTASLAQGLRDRGQRLGELADCGTGQRQ